MATIKDVARMAGVSASTVSKYINGGHLRQENIDCIRDAIEKLKNMKKDNIITEDDQANGEKKIQNLTDKFCAEVDTLLAAKEKEILEI